MRSYQCLSMYRLEEEEGEGEEHTTNHGIFNHSKGFNNFVLKDKDYVKHTT